MGIGCRAGRFELLLLEIGRESVILLFMGLWCRSVRVVDINKVVLG